MGAIIKADALGSGIEKTQQAVSDMLNGLGADLAEVNSRIQEAQGVAMGLEATDEEIGRLDSKEAKRIEQELSAKIKNAEAARKKFRANYETPLKRVTLAYQEAMEPVVALHAKYKERRATAEDERKQEARSTLENTYLSFMEGNGMSELAASVPFDAIADSKWWNLSANPKKSEAEMLKRASEVIGDWRRLGDMQWRYPDQAKAHFLRTLSLGETADMDRRMAEEADRVAAIEAERDAAEKWMREMAAEAPAYEEPPQYEEQQCEAQEPHMVNYEPEEFSWVVRFKGTEAQKEQVKALLIGMGVHGSIAKEAANGK